MTGARAEQTTTDGRGAAVCSSRAPHEGFGQGEAGTKVNDDVR